MKNNSKNRKADRIKRREIGNISAHKPDKNKPKGSVNFIIIEDVPATLPSK